MCVFYYLPGDEGAGLFSAAQDATDAEMEVDHKQELEFARGFLEGGGSAPDAVAGVSDARRRVSHGRRGPDEEDLLHPLPPDDAF